MKRGARFLLMKKALVLFDTTSDYASRPETVVEILKDIYDGLFEIECTPGYSTLTVEQLRQFHLVIVMAAKWDELASRQSVAALLQYAVSGGAVLAIGDILKNERWYELDCLFGKHWLNSSTPCLQNFSPVGEHRITEGTKAFNLVEYTNFYELDPILEPELLLNLSYAGKDYPAAWCHSYGWGKVACFTIGNIPESYLPEFRRILWRCGEWFLNRL